MRVEALKDQLGELNKLSGQQRRDMDARPRRCRAEDAELSSILYDKKATSYNKLRKGQEEVPHEAFEEG